MDLTQIEVMIARDARRVLDNPERPPTADLALGLRSLLSLHLPTIPFVDVVHPTLRIRPDYRLELRALMVWGTQCVEVFGADLHPAEDRDALHSYVLYFGRQDQPDRKVAYEQRAEILPELRKAGEWAWAHVLTKNPNPKSQ
jgi:hypothetical protein